MTSTTSALAFIVISCLLGLAFSGWLVLSIKKTKILQSADETPLADSTGSDHTTRQRLYEIYSVIEEGAKAFLHAEYMICLYFIVGFGLILLFLISWAESSFMDGFLTFFAFACGACTSILSGYIGMRVAVFSNVRTTIQAMRPGWADCFNVAFNAGGVMGFTLCSLGILVLIILLAIYRTHFSIDEYELMMDCISGYGLGGSSIALFGRVGGGIYTKAADVGADLVGKVVHGIPEDDPRNPAVIADNVGDNVGDVAGMGADLFGSFAESTCACLVIAASSASIREDGGYTAILFPIAVSALGLLVCMATSFVATVFWPVKEEKDVEWALKLQLVITTILIIPFTYAIANSFLPSSFVISGVTGDVTATPDDAFVCVISGAIGGLIIGLITEYYTSHSYQPVRQVAFSCTTGSATNIIYGLALGYKSVIIPVFVLALVIFTAFELCDMYGCALAAVGMLSTLATGLTIDAYGPVCDNAGGIAEMAELPPEVREKTDALDAAGNTTAAVGKGFAIGSAALVSLALFGAFVTRLDITTGVNILEPLPFAFLLIGAMIPYWFSALTMKSVGNAAMKMVAEVERQFRENPALLEEGTEIRPDYRACVEISTQASLKEMIPPGALVMLAPLVTGSFFGVYAVFGLLSGALVSSVQMAISMSNTGGAWDNAKKYIEKADADSELQGKGSDVHKAAVVGDTVGDPMKDTSGPSLNIVMKLMAIISLVFASFFQAINDGRGVFDIDVE
jgi:inorganic pyrophosphatase